MANIAKFRSVPSTNFYPSGLFNDFFNGSIANFIGSDALISQPAVNVLETNDAFKVELAAPGFEKKDFSLKVEDHRLTITAKREQTSENNSERFTRREFRYESFERMFKLPETVNQESVSAVYENGVLQVTLPKKEDAKAVTKAISVG